MVFRAKQRLFTAIALSTSLASLICPLGNRMVSSLALSVSHYLLIFCYLYVALISPHISLELGIADVAVESVSVNLLDVVKFCRPQ